MVWIRLGSPARLFAAAVALAMATPGSARGQQSYGIDFVTVGAVNNPAFNIVNPDDPGSLAVGRGSVGYEYRIGRTEITTIQWMEFVNTFNGTTAANAPPYFHWAGPFHWGAVPDPTYSGPGFRYVLPASNPSAGMQPVFGISWRESALYCNWLQGGKQADPASLRTGAYDTTTWGTGPGGSFTDAPTHLPGARFWVPTLDEQIKAACYDPNRFGPGQGGWWLGMNKRNAAGVPGLPGIGQTSAGCSDPTGQERELDIPLGAYTDQTSPWGLYDTSGGAMEWNEALAPAPPSLPRGRGIFGRPAGPAYTANYDSIYGISAPFPGDSGVYYGLRIASAAPSPTGVSVFAVLGLTCGARRRRKTE